MRYHYHNTSIFVKGKSFPCFLMFFIIPNCIYFIFFKVIVGQIKNQKSSKPNKQQALWRAEKQQVYLEIISSKSCVRRQYVYLWNHHIETLLIPSYNLYLMIRLSREHVNIHTSCQQIQIALRKNLFIKILHCTPSTNITSSQSLEDHNNFSS